MTQRTRPRQRPRGHVRAHRPARVVRAAPAQPAERWGPRWIAFLLTMAGMVVVAILTRSPGCMWPLGIVACAAIGATLPGDLLKAYRGLRE